MTALTLRGLEAAYKATEKAGATPHRTPDFRRLKKLVDPAAPIKGRMWFIEEHNTGYPGVLFRWQFVVPVKPGAKLFRKDFDNDGKPLSFWADLLPDLISDTNGRTPEPLASY